MISSVPLVRIGLNTFVYFSAVTYTIQRNRFRFFAKDSVIGPLLIKRVSGYIVYTIEYTILCSATFSVTLSSVRLISVI